MSDMIETRGACSGHAGRSFPCQLFGISCSYHPLLRCWSAGWKDNSVAFFDVLVFCAGSIGKRNTHSLCGAVRSSLHQSCGI